MTDTAYTLYSWIARAFVLFTAMPVHEWAHGFVADRLGDPTPRQQGRLTLNPLHHLDLIGSVLLVLAGFGWAKPVQVDARYFKKPKRDMALTALAGPLSNIFFATVTMLVYKYLWSIMYRMRYDSAVITIILMLVYTMINTNLYLAVFNLLPVPPLDGAKIFGAVLPDRYYFTVMRYERYIALVIFLLIFFTDVLTGPLFTAANFLFTLLDHATAPIARLF